MLRFALFLSALLVSGATADSLRGNAGAGEDVAVFEFDGNDAKNMRFKRGMFSGNSAFDAAVQGYRKDGQFGRGYQNGGLALEFKTPEKSEDSETFAFSDAAFYSSVILDEPSPNLRLQFDYHIQWDFHHPKSPEKGKLLAQLGHRRIDFCGAIPCFHGGEAYVEEWKTAVVDFGPMPKGKQPLALGAELLHTSSSTAHQMFTVQFDNVHVVSTDPNAPKEQHEENAEVDLAGSTHDIRATVSSATKRVRHRR